MSSTPAKLSLSASLPRSKIDRSKGEARTDAAGAPRTLRLHSGSTVPGRASQNNLPRVPHIAG